MYYQRDNITIYNADCLEVMAQLPTDSIDLIFVDWPYYKVKDEPWDRQWNKPAAFLGWIEQTLVESKRILKPNGSLYGCASPQMADDVKQAIKFHFNVLNTIRWYKDDGWHKKTDKESLRQYLNPWEAIIFAEQYGSDSVALGESQYISESDKLRGFVFEPIRAYLDGERIRAGIDKISINICCGFSATAGGMASRHYFSSSQWQFPTKEHYEAMQVLFNSNIARPQYLRREYEDLRREYEDLRREYEDLRREYEDLRRPFYATTQTPHTDLWTFAPVKDYPGKHPTEKPLALVEHIIKTSSRPGDTVLDFCMGTGVTLQAVRNLGRKAIGIDKHLPYCERAKAKLLQPTLLTPAMIEPSQSSEQLSLFGGDSVS